MSLENIFDQFIILREYARIQINRQLQKEIEDKNHYMIESCKAERSIKRLTDCLNVISEPVCPRGKISKHNGKIKTELRRHTFYAPFLTKEIPMDEISQRPQMKMWDLEEQSKIIEQNILLKTQIEKLQLNNGNKEII